MKKIIAFLVACCATFGVMAQSADELLFLSRYYPGGTARSVAMGGAFGALGGDLSSPTNPAGIAVYRGAEFTFSLAVPFNNTKSWYNGYETSESNSKFVLNNIGYVYTWDFNRPSGFQSLSLGLAYNRLSEFNRDAFIGTPHAGSSMLDEFSTNVNNGIYEDFYEGLAEATQTIWESSAGENGYPGWINDYILAGSGGKGIYGQEMTRRVNTRGGLGEYSFSVGANYNNLLFMGASLGLQDVYYRNSYFHEEFPGFPLLDYYNFSDDYATNGFGMNMKLGLIVRPIHILRIGAAIQTPTYFWMRSEFMTEMEAIYNQPPIAGSRDDWFYAESPIAETKYKAITPWRYSTSAAVLFGSYGLFSAEMEYVDYSKSKLRPNSDYSALNDDIGGAYTNAINLKTGIEGRLGPLSLRAGVAYLASPYKGDSYTTNGTPIYSGGIGFRGNSFYIDAAYSFTKLPTEAYRMYNVGSETSYADLNTNANKIIVTVGFRL